MHTATMMLLRTTHAMRKALDEGTFTGTREQRESVMEMIGDVEEVRVSLLESLTAEDIWQLDDEGVLWKAANENRDAAQGGGAGDFETWGL